MTLFSIQQLQADLDCVRDVNYLDPANLRLVEALKELEAHRDRAFVDRATILMMAAALAQVQALLPRVTSRELPWITSIRALGLEPAGAALVEHAQALLSEAADAVAYRQGEWLSSTGGWTPVNFEKLRAIITSGIAP